MPFKLPLTALAVRISLSPATIGAMIGATIGGATISPPAVAQPASNANFDRAVLAQLDAPTRAEVQKRAVKGNTVTGVIGTMLLNNYYAAGARKPGEALTVVAVDFARGAVVFRRSASVFEVQRFNPQNLHVQR